MTSRTLNGFSPRTCRILSIIQPGQILAVIMSAKSLKIRKLVFRHDALDILRLALDTVSQTSICLDGHSLNDRVDRRWISCSTTLWTLGLVANVFIQLVGMCHVSTSKISGSTSAEHAVMQYSLSLFHLGAVQAERA